ncbi:hypothetical protein [Thermosulfurimonas sp. F29]|uniref:hypothetical protein n=1 Tax=Thermosulfurimonas sp. F29 TaxID=2867247 RepID=UPI001C833B3D|nr:hypothetical protein [Thermosulfurimonas sp. F29]MBX6424104.1 hypothetical protein [Thermosulfurimonas sp. F29]
MAGFVPDVDSIRVDGKRIKVEIPLAQVANWMLTIYRLSGVTEDLALALEFAYSAPKGRDEEHAVHMVQELLRQEASGNIEPPLSFGELYRRVVTAATKGGDAP